MLTGDSRLYVLTGNIHAVHHHERESILQVVADGSGYIHNLHMPPNTEAWPGESVEVTVTVNYLTAPTPPPNINFRKVQ